MYQHLFSLFSTDVKVVSSKNSEVKFFVLVILMLWVVINICGVNSYQRNCWVQWTFKSLTLSTCPQKRSLAVRLACPAGLLILVARVLSIPLILVGKDKGVLCISWILCEAGHQSFMMTIFFLLTVNTVCPFFCVLFRFFLICWYDLSVSLVF